MPRYKRKTNSKSNQRLKEQKAEITGVLLIGFASLAVVAMYLDNAGVIGDILKRVIYYLFGERGAFLPMVFVAIFGGMLISRKKLRFFNRRLISLLLLMVFALVFLNIISKAPITNSDWEVAIKSCGVIGYLLTKLFLACFGKLGTGIVLVILVLIAFILALEKPLIEVVKSMLPQMNSEDNRYEESNNKKAKGKEVKVVTEDEVPAAPQSQNKVLVTLQEMMRDQGQRKDALKSDNKKEDQDLDNNTIDFVPKTPMKSGPYKLPDIQLIEKPAGRSRKTSQMPDQSKQLEEALAQFGVQVKVIDVHHGPVITRYDLQPAPGVKISKIVNLTDDLALALAAKGLRLEAPIPGKAAIGVEVPNKETQIVVFRDMIESKAFWDSGKLCVALGVDIAGEVVLADLGKMPHLLIAGATGSGKSVCVNTLIMSVLFKAFPNEVKFIMIDPKMVELSMYNGIPHLLAPVVTEAKKASGALKLVVDEMERRYKLFAEARVRDLEKYNALQEDEAEKLPFIIVLIDELADLMMVAPVEVEDSICRLAQMARATGIHLVVATQRPSVDVITGLIKANIPSRIAFAVSSQVDSRTILDCMGAERLLGRGDMLFFSGRVDETAAGSRSFGC